jgi:O-antigen/teichoic acid export membrane protein
MNQEALPEQSLSHKIIRNTAYNIAGRFWGILAVLFLTPYIISHIGIERFGVWSIAGVITGYFGLLDFGVGMSFVKYIAEFYTKKQFDKIDQIVNTGFIFYSLLTVFIIFLSALFIKPLIAIFKIPPYLSNEAVFVLLVGISVFSFSNAFSPFSAIQTGLQRMDIQNKIVIVLSILNILGTVFFLEKGYGLPGLMVNNAMIFIISCILNVSSAHKILPEMKFNPALFSKEMFNKLFTFGFKIQIAKIAGIIASQTNKLLIAYFLSIGLVTFYHLGNSVVYYAISISALFVSALMPAFSEMEAKGERQKLTEAYLMTTRYLAFFVAPFFVFLIISAFNLMSAWMGAGYEKSAVIIQILALSYAFNTIAQVAVSICMAIDRPQVLAVGSVIIIILNLVLSIVFIKIFGFMGPALGTLFSINIGTLYFLAVLNNILRIPHRKFIKMTAPYFLIAVISSGVIVIFDLVAHPLGRAVSRSMALGVLCMRGLVFLSIYLIGVYLGKLINADDIDFLRQKFSFVRRKK